ncbi:RNA 2'-phosphotransferase [Paenibacillus paridis]|uniref:RNA 2'-phosphotransferase n=1 Tax=Paenibacillus paridis TaxID=2583376 RepID=UPI0011219DE2|nr:RNA 2'-phosphotransferase [Paenibacillus paridis]
MDYQKLSKELSYILRHAPWSLGLELDEEGWVRIDHLIEAMQERKPWEQLQESDLVAMIDAIPKKRHELAAGKIRAIYGHSVPEIIVRERKKPPEVLYHGTSRELQGQIMTNGLRPMARQNVHLSIETATAMNVGRRKDRQPLLLRIDAERAWQAGIAFYQGDEVVWLADHIPAEYIRVDGV